MPFVWGLLSVLRLLTVALLQLASTICWFDSTSPIEQAQPDNVRDFVRNFCLRMAVATLGMIAASSKGQSQTS